MPSVGGLFSMRHLNILMMAHFVSVGDLKFSLELENNPFEVTMHLGDMDVLDAINSYSYRFQDATLIIGEWNGSTGLDPNTSRYQKGIYRYSQ